MSWLFQSNSSDDLPPPPDIDVKGIQDAKVQKLMVLLEEFERENMTLSCRVKELEEMEVVNKGLNETIEELVTEYSTLAASSELRREHDATIAADLRGENDLLRERLTALEHSVSAMADRAVEESGSGRDSRGKGTNDSALKLELREARSQIVNLQFDNRKLNNGLRELKARYDALLESVDELQEGSAETEAEVKADKGINGTTATSGVVEGDEDDEEDQVWHVVSGEEDDDQLEPSEE